MSQTEPTFREAAESLVERVREVTNGASRDWPNGNPTPEQWGSIVDATRKVEDAAK